MVERSKNLISRDCLPVWGCCFTVAALELFCWLTEDDEFDEAFELLGLLPALVPERRTFKHTGIFNMSLLVLSNSFYPQIAESSVVYQCRSAWSIITDSDSNKITNAKITFLTSTWRNWNLSICRSRRICSSSSWGTEYCLWYQTRHEWNKPSSLSSPFRTATCTINTANKESVQSWCAHKPRRFFVDNRDFKISENHSSFYFLYMKVRHKNEPFLFSTVVVPLVPDVCWNGFFQIVACATSSIHMI